MRVMRCAAAWLLVILMACPVALAETMGEAEPSLQERAFMGAFSETPEELIVSAMEVYSWFTISPLDVDPELMGGSGGVWRVADEALCHVDVMMRLMDFIFSPEIVDYLMNYGPYTVIDGMLYGAAGGRSVDPRISNVEYEESTADDEKIVYTVTVHYLDEAGKEMEPDVLEFVREKIEGQWVFTVFPFFW